MANSRRSFGAAAVCLLGVLLLAAPLSAQTVLGRVAGTVLDYSGGVLPGATVTLTNVAPTRWRRPSPARSGRSRSRSPAGHLQGRRRAVGVQDGRPTTQVVINVGQEYSLTAKLDRRS